LLRLKQPLALANAPVAVLRLKSPLASACAPPAVLRLPAPLGSARWPSATFGCRPHSRPRPSRSQCLH
jgi:hypothetical protein